MLLKEELGLVVGDLMNNGDYQKVVDRLLPPGQRPPITELRSVIRAALEKAVGDALEWQRREEFPDLAKSMAEAEKRLKAREDKIKEKERELFSRHDAQEKRDIALGFRESAQHLREERFKEMAEALNSYIKWQEELDGDVSELKVRYMRLRIAYRKYKGLI